MAVTVFVWDMFRKTDEGFSVGHASMFVKGDKGTIYISFWPSQHSLSAGWHSAGVVHFINADVKANGRPTWASKPLDNLDEGAIIDWWSKVQSNPFIDYKHKTPIQISGAEHASPGNMYSIVLNQCAIAVVRALLIGASPSDRDSIMAWLQVNGGSTPYLVHVPVITPQDVRELVEAVF